MIIPGHCVYFAGSRIGKDCKIFPGAVIGAIPQDLKFGETSLPESGTGCDTPICNGESQYRGQQVGNDTMLMAYVHVAHDCIIVLGEFDKFSRTCNNRRFMPFGGMSSSTHQFTESGKHSFVSGGSIGKDVPPFCHVLQSRAICRN